MQGFHHHFALLDVRITCIVYRNRNKKYELVLQVIHKGNIVLFIVP